MARDTKLPSPRYLNRLALAAVVAAASACGVAEPAEPPAPGTVAEVESSLTCGGMVAGEVLYPNQSLKSCNGKANLVHQSDGNVVLYDGVGALWTTNTYGKATTGFTMQGDGNLVLYANTGAVWTSGTGGRSGARFAVQDDCNLVVYSSTGSVLWASYTFCRTPPVDPVNYMINTSGCTLRDPVGGNVQQTRHDTVNRRFWIQKNPYESDRWERYGYDSSRVYLDRDTTLPAGEGPGTAYDVSPFNGMYFPRSWNVGGVVNFDVWVKYFNHRQACSYVSGDMRWNQGRHKLRYQGAISLGGDLGTLSDVIIIDRYNDLAVDPWQPRGAERFWYARGYGWVRWESWNDRTTDPRWDSNSVSNLNGTAPNRRVTFNQRWCGNVGFSDVCTGLRP